MGSVYIFESGCRGSASGMAADAAVTVLLLAGLTIFPPMHWAVCPRSELTPQTPLLHYRLSQLRRPSVKLLDTLTWQQ